MSNRKYSSSSRKYFPMSKQKPPRHLHLTNDHQKTLSTNNKMPPNPKFTKTYIPHKTNLVSKTIHTKIATDKIIPNTKHLSIPNERLPITNTTKPTCTLHTSTNQLVPIRNSSRSKKKTTYLPTSTLLQPIAKYTSNIYFINMNKNRAPILI